MPRQRRHAERAWTPGVAGGGVYQAWVAVGTEIQPSSVSVVDRDAQAAVAIPTGLDGADEVIVTREPAGGSEQPAGPPLLRASLS